MKTTRAAEIAVTRLWLAGWLVVCAAVPRAQAADDGSFYVDASALRILHTLNLAELNAGVNNAVTSGTGTSLGLASTSTQRSTVTWSAALGYRISEFFAVEASYLDLGDLNYHATGTETSATGTASLASALRITAKGPALAMVGILPLMPGLEVSLRAGAFDGRTATDYVNTVNGTPGAGSISKSTVSLLGGVGASYAFAGNWAVQFQYLHLNGLQEKLLDRKFNADVAMAGLMFVF